MTGRITTRIAAVLAAAITIAGAGISTASASASPLPAHSASAFPVRAETDNGTAWTLYPGRLGASTGTQAGYADAGEVMSLGSVASFGGITAKGSANLSENIWITDGSEATVPGTHQLSTPVDFSYGFQQPGTPTTWTRARTRGRPSRLLRSRPTSQGTTCSPGSASTRREPPTTATSSRLTADRCPRCSASCRPAAR